MDSLKLLQMAEEIAERGSKSLASGDTQEAMAAAALVSSIAQIVEQIRAELK